MSRNEPDNPVQAYGAWVAEVPAEWPEAAIESARRQFIDVLAVMIPGVSEPAARKALMAVEAWGDGPCTIVGSSARMAPPWAALVNGTAAHTLDFDDNFDPAKAHATAVLAPAILTLAEERRMGGAAVLDAYIAGLQILGRVGQGLNPFHRNRGWHATSTVGAIGAAAACARLLKLDREAAAHALSIATSMAGGFMAQFGTMTKPLHAGLAAKAGVMAATLAGTGMEASADALDGPHGMQRLMVGQDHAELRDALAHVEHGQTLHFETRTVGEPLLILEHGFRVKRYPICGSAHRAIDGLLDLREAHGFGAGDIAEIHVHAPASHLANLMYRRPSTVLEAKFSLEYGLASALLDGDCGLDAFTDAAVARPELSTLYERIHRHPVDLPESAFPTKVAVQLVDGRNKAIEVAMPRGSIAAPFPLETYWRKFDACTAGLLTPAQAARIRDALDHLPDLPDIGDLMRATAADAGSLASRRSAGS